MFAPRRTVMPVLIMHVCACSHSHTHTMATAHAQRPGGISKIEHKQACSAQTRATPLVSKARLGRHPPLGAHQAPPASGTVTLPFPLACTPGASQGRSTLTPTSSVVRVKGYIRVQGIGCTVLSLSRSALVLVGSVGFRVRGFWVVRKGFNV